LSKDFYAIIMRLPHQPVEFNLELPVGQKPENQQPVPCHQSEYEPFDV
jgi:hypothetical protein